MKTKQFLFLGICLLVIGVSCQQPPGKQTATGDAASPENKASQTDSTAQLSNTLVEVYNEVQSDVRDWEENYFRFIDPEKGPEPQLLKSNIGISLWPSFEADDPTNGITGDNMRILASKTKSGSKDSVYLQAGAYVTAINNLVDVMKQVRNYYKQGGHKDDNLARGKQLHTQFMQALNAYLYAEDGVNSLLAAMEDRDLDQAIANAKGTAPVKHQALSIFKSSKELLLASKKPNNAGNAAVVSGAASLEKQVEELKALVAKEKSSADNTKQFHIANLESYVRECDNMVASSKNLARKIATPEKESQSFDNLKSNLLRDYNSLVSSYSNMTNLPF